MQVELTEEERTALMRLIGHHTSSGGALQSLYSRLYRKGDFELPPFESISVPFYPGRAMVEVK